MRLFKNTCNRTVCFILLTIILTAVPAGADSAKSLELQWKFPDGTQYQYSIHQEAKIQHYYQRENQERPVRSAIHTETTQGTLSLQATSDGNAYGDLILQLLDIKENDSSLDVPAKQKIPQKVCRFILSPDGAMEQYSGPKKETYILTRLILGIPIQRLKMSEVRVYPFTLYTDRDETRSPMTGRISHEFNAVETVGGDNCARILTTVDLTDGSPGGNITSSTWKGTSTSLFNIESGRLESAEWSLAIKQTMKAEKEIDPVMSVQIYTIKVKRTSVP